MRWRQRKSFAAIIAMLIAWPSVQAASTAPPLQSGFYEGFVLAVASSGRVVGHFNMEQGSDAAKRCIFDFAGQVNGNQAVIHVVGSPDLSGRITASTADEVMFSMAQIKNLPGCGLVLPSEAQAESGLELDRIKPGHWTDLAEVHSARVALKPAPDGPAGRAYVVKGDVVGILARQGNQVQVVYPSERDSWAQGWVAAADLAPLAP